MFTITILIVLVAAFLAAALFMAQPRTRRQDSDIGSPRSIPGGPQALSGQWVEAESAVTIEFDGKVNAGTSQIPDVRARDSYGTPFRSIGPAVNINSTRLKIPMAFDASSGNTLGNLQLQTTNLGIAVKDDDGAPVQDQFVNQLLNVPTAGLPRIIAVLVEDDNAPRIVFYTDTKCDWSGGADDVRLYSDNSGNTIGNLGDFEGVVGGGARFQSTTFVASAPEIPDHGVVSFGIGAVTHVGTLDQSAAVELPKQLLLPDSPSTPVIVHATWIADTTDLELELSEPCIATGPIGGHITMVDGNGTFWMADSITEIADEVVTVKMVFNPDGAGSINTFTTNGIGFVLRSQATNLPLQDVVSVEPTAQAPVAAPFIIDAQYHLGSALLDLTFNTAIAVAANPATATDIFFKPPGGADTLHNAVGVALLSVGSTITGIPCATVDNTVPCAADTTTSALEAGDITGDVSAVDVLPWTGFPVRIVA